MASLPFPQALTEKHRPRAFAEFVGLDKPKAILSKLASAPFPSAWLFVGPSGTGKTTMALALADMMPAELHHVPSQECNVGNLENVIRMCWYVPQAGKRVHLVLVDEADQMTPAAQLALLSKLDSTAFPPATIFVFTCNSTERLQERFLSRCRVIEFTGPNGELAPYLAHIWELEAPRSIPDSDTLAKLAASGNVRDALMRLELELMAIY